MMGYGGDPTWAVHADLPMPDISNALGLILEASALCYPCDTVTSHSHMIWYQPCSEYFNLLTNKFDPSLHIIIFFRSNRSATSGLQDATGRQASGFVNVFFLVVISRS